MATRVTLGCKHESEVATYRVVVADLVNSTVHHACKIWILQAKEEKTGGVGKLCTCMWFVQTAKYTLQMSTHNLAKNLAILQ